MKKKNIKTNQNENIKDTTLISKLKLSARNIKNRVKDFCINLKEEDKKELFTNIFSSRYFTLFIFIIILLKTLVFSMDTVFYKNGGIWPWYIRQTSFFIIILVAPMLLFRKSRSRFAYGIILNFLVSLLLFSDELYYEYASNIISVMQARKCSI